MNKSEMELALVLVAAGSSSRFSRGEKIPVKKEYLPLNGGTVLSTAARIFLATKKFSIAAVTYPFAATAEELKSNEEKCRAALLADDFIKAQFDSGNTKFIFVPGGSTRQKSVLKALEAIQSDNSQKIVFIHDGARPFIKADLIERTLEAALKNGASVPGLQPADTQKEIDDNGFIKTHLKRSNLSAVQTPQVFHLNEILEGHRKAEKAGVECTDDTEIWDNFVVPFEKGFRTVKVVEGDSENKKITYKSDFNSETEKETFGGKKMIRTGIGYDKHVLISGRKLMLGGVEIPSEKGEDGHSDGDVLLHAITDAVLGASALGDIGSYFPPSDPQWKDADSKMLLGKCWSDVVKNGWKLCNIDCVIALEKPKFLPYRDAVRESIAEVLGCSKEQVFVKAKTGEKTGDVGTGKVVEAYVTCLLEK